MPDCAVCPNLKMQYCAEYSATSSLLNYVPYEHQDVQHLLQLRDLLFFIYIKYFLIFCLQ
jgi:hypothetical protein